MPCSLHREP
ncbi:hypothetical protein LINPERHAP2_LOCUS15617 [Linum perenne]